MAMTTKAAVVERRIRVSILPNTTGSTLINFYNDADVPPAEVVIVGWRVEAWESPTRCWHIVMPITVDGDSDLGTCCVVERIGGQERFIFQQFADFTDREQAMAYGKTLVENLGR